VKRRELKRWGHETARVLGWSIVCGVVFTLGAWVSML
jgi:hypothetical protein